MGPAKRYLIPVLLAAILVLPSCSSFHPFGDPTEPAPAGQEEVQSEEALESGSQAGEQMDALQEKIVALEDKVNTLESQVSGQKKVVYTIEYSDPAQLYQKARTLLLSKDYGNAADLFTTFAKEHPGHALADNALYWLGECHYTTGRYELAAEVFKELVKTYPKAEKVPDALLKTGYAYLSLDDVVPGRPLPWPGQQFRSGMPRCASYASASNID